MLAAVLMLIGALAAGVAPRESTTGVEAPAPGGGSAPAGSTVVRSIPAEAGAKSRVSVRRGDLLQLEVTGNVLDSVLLERLDRIDGVEPGTPARFELLVDAPAGAYPIRLVEADRRIGTIEIRE